jgi:CheY-like chemotaxis protein
MNPTRVLIADDDLEMRRLLAQTLRDASIDVIEASDGVAALTMLLDNEMEPSSDIDLVVTDVRMPGLNGLSLLEGLRALNWHKPIVLISAFADDDLRAEAQKFGASAVLAKPFGLDEFMQTVQTLTDNSSRGVLVVEQV